MLNKHPDPIQYLAIGHLASDVQPDGRETLGGTAAYAALTATAAGLRAGIVTAMGEHTDFEALHAIPIAGTWDDRSTTFENIATPAGRKQRILHLASSIRPAMVPDSWRSCSIVHIAPLADEIDLDLLRLFPNSQICLTPQGWLRQWDREGWVSPTDWPEARFVLQKAAASVLSIEDVGGDEDLIEFFAEASSILVITEGAGGCRLFLEGEVFHCPAPRQTEIDSIGAGDIFAAAFFTRLYQSGDPLEAARFAVHIASLSITRSGMESIPTQDEIQDSLIKVV